MRSNKTGIAIPLILAIAILSLFSTVSAAENAPWAGEFKSCFDQNNGKMNCGTVISKCANAAHAKFNDLNDQGTVCAKNCPPLGPNFTAEQGIACSNDCYRGFYNWWVPDPNKSSYNFSKRVDAFGESLKSACLPTTNASPAIQLPAVQPSTEEFESNEPNMTTVDTFSRVVAKYADIWLTNGFTEDFVREAMRKVISGQSVNSATKNLMEQAIEKAINNYKSANSQTPAVPQPEAEKSRLELCMEKGFPKECCVPPDYLNNPECRVSQKKPPTETKAEKSVPEAEKAPSLPAAQQEQQGQSQAPKFNLIQTFYREKLVPGLKSVGSFFRCVITFGFICRQQ